VLGGTKKAEDILPHFIVTQLPHGLAGLVMSAALAAAMASLSSCINAAGMVWINDLYRRHLVPGKIDLHYLRTGRVTSLIVSVLMAVGAYLFYIAPTKTILEFVLVITALLGGGISGAFLFGMLTRLGDAKAVLIGIAATVSFTVYALLVEFRVFPRVFEAYYTSILGNLLMFGVCCFSAFCLPKNSRDLTNLTVWDQSKEPLK
jgi:SSS family solute:Na+ symporter